MKALERIVAEKLLKIKAVKLQPANPFTWASGWKSPIYCDNRKTLSYPAIRTFIAQARSGRTSLFLRRQRIEKNVLVAKGASSSACNRNAETAGESA